MAACILGPRYLLSRKGRETLPSFAFDSAGASLPFKFIDSDAVEQTIPDTYAVDADSVALYGTKLEAQLATFADTVCSIPDITQPNVVKILTNKFKGGTLNSGLHGRAVQVGDIVYTTGTNGGAQTRRTVRSLLGTDVAASVGTPAVSPYNPVATTAAVTTVSVPTNGTVTVDDAALFDGLAVGSKVDNKYGEEYIVTVTTGGLPGVAVVAVSTVSGHFSATNVATAAGADTDDFLIDNTAVFGGCAITIGLGGGTGVVLVQGQVFRFKLKGTYIPIAMGTGLAVSGTYTGTKDTTYLIEVIEKNTSGADFSGAKVRITDTAGIDDVIDSTTIAEATNFDLGSLGLQAKFEDLAVVVCKLRVGDIFSVAATAATASTTTFDKIVLDGPAVDTAIFAVAGTLYEVQMRLPFTGKILATDSVDEVAWEQTGNVSLDYESALALNVTDRTSSPWCPFVDAIGTLEVSFRAIVPTTASEALQNAGTAAEIAEKAGPDDLDNDLGYAVARAWEASGGKTTYFSNTGGIELADFTDAFKKISSTKATYALGIVTSDDTIVAAARAHAVAMSAETVKNFRKIYFGVDSPGQYRVLALQPDDQYFTCTISAYGPLNRMVTLGAGDVDFTTLDLHDGDLLVLPNANESHEIESVLSATELLLKTGPASPVSPAVPFYLDKVNTVANQKSYLRAKARAQAQARATMVWCENGTATVNGTTTVIPCRFLACYVAGLRAGLRPQQGLTRREIPMITSASAMHTRYTPTDLNEIAADGVLIITQDVDSGKIYIRHQLTTDSSNGILLYEDNVYPIVDYLSFQYDDGLDPFVGKKNVTQATLTEMRNVIADISEEAKNADYNSAIGPLIVGYSNLTVTRNALVRDRVDTSIDVEIPTPLNTIIHTINGSYSTATPV